MADESLPGPSRQKKPRVRVCDSNNLTEDEMLAYLLYSDSEEEPFNNSDSEWSGAEDMADEVTEDDHVNNNQHDNTDFSQNVNADKQPIDIQWAENPPVLKNFAFTGKQELKVPVPGEGKPIDFFNLFADDAFYDMLLTETNRYAEYVFLHEPQGPHSRISRWKCVVKKEMAEFLGISFLMGIIQLPRLRDYWRTDRFYNLSVRNYMSRDRYLIILRCLHFTQNVQERETPPEDRLYKIRPLLELFNRKIVTIYAPGKNLSLDESMLLWRGRLLFRQYIKNKKHKYGIKFYVLCESDGTVLNMRVYTGAGDDTSGKGHGAKVVLSLLSNYCNKGHSVYMDNYYNSVLLARQLLDKMIYCTGTLRAQRKETPAEVSKAKLQIGESIHRYGGNVCVGKWRDKREVLYLTTEHTNDFEDVTSRSGNRRLKPKPIAQYNRYMSGIDLHDQMLSYYPSHRKTIRWYKKVGFYIFDIMMYNSFKLYSKYSGPKMAFLDYRQSIIAALLVDDEIEANRNTPKSRGTVSHLPTKCESATSGRKLRKRCRNCSKRGIRKDTMYYCQMCPDLPGLCLETCFKDYHTEQ